MGGPAFVRLHDGALLVLGKKIGMGEEVIVQKNRSVPIETEGNSIFEIKLGSGANIEEVDRVIPRDWKIAVEAILNNKLPVKVMIIGDVDSGKTTFAAYLSNRAFDAAFDVAVVDADPGQGEISPPTTVGFGFLECGITSLNNIPLERAYFIGSTSPSEFPTRIIVGARALTEKALAKEADLVVVNTCGWVAGKKARDYKISLIQSIAPDFLVIIQRGTELEPLIKVFERVKMSKVLRITTSPASRVRSREERKMRREDAYQRYFAKSRERTFDLQKIPLMNSYYTYGRSLPSTLLEDLQRQVPMKLFYGELGDDFLFLVADREADITTINKLREITGINDVVIMPKGSEKGIILGMITSDGEFAGLGVISHIDYESRKATVITPVNIEVAILQIGHLKLDGCWHEIVKFPYIAL